MVKNHALIINEEFDDDKVIVTLKSKYSIKNEIFDIIDLNNSQNIEEVSITLSAGTYYLKTFYTNNNSSGTITTSISRPHVHDYSDDYVHVNYTQHRAYCSCGSYVISLELDPASDKGPYWYKREIATNAGTEIEPVFHYMKLKLTIDKNFRILKIEVNEEYEVNKIITATAITNYTETFSYENVDFPNDIKEKYKN